jgi:hypothetical protein
MIFLHDAPPVEEIILTGNFSAKHMPVKQNPWTMNFKVLQDLQAWDLGPAFQAR